MRLTTQKVKKIRKEVSAISFGYSARRVRVIHAYSDELLLSLSVCSRLY